jgi:hypothetical protein
MNLCVGFKNLMSKMPSKITEARRWVQMGSALKYGEILKT